MVKAMNYDELIDSFVEKVNSFPRESGTPEEIPENLREGEEDEYGDFQWKIRPIENAVWLDLPLRRKPKRFPNLFMNLITRYSFPAFEVGDVFLFGNTGQPVFYEFADRLHADKLLTESLFHEALLPFGCPGECNYDPVCFDGKRQSRKSLDCPIVLVEHEEILCNDKVQVKKELYPSFETFILKVIEG